MSKTAIPVLAIWAAALGSAGALAYTLNRPPNPVAKIGQVAYAAMLPSLAEPRPAPPNDETSFAPLVVHKAKRAQPRPAAAPPPARDLSEMRCTNWEDLTQGMASVQVRRCE
jgi:hypothetical protein